MTATTPRSSCTVITDTRQEGPLRLQHVSEGPGKGFVARCVACNRMIPAGTTKVADLDGPPFMTYYHTTCAPYPTPDRAIEEFAPET